MSQPETRIHGKGPWRARTARPRERAAACAGTGTRTRSLHPLPALLLAFVAAALAGACVAPGAEDGAREREVAELDAERAAEIALRKAKGEASAAEVAALERYVAGDPR